MAVIMDKEIGITMTNVNYSIVFQFEKEFNEPTFTKYMNDNWTDSFVYAAVYLLVIFGGKHLMHHRPRYDLRPALAVWSGTLAVFSIAGAVRTLPEITASVFNHSLQYSVCVPSYFVQEVTKFWACLFVVSKVFELGDTLFIVLRKQHLIFLHWYHHITVLIYVWYSYPDHTAPGRWFMVMNYVIHSFMYTYYTLRALRFRVPSWVNVVITSLQILQMSVGVAINIWIYQIKSRGDYCQQSFRNVRLSSLMYFSYFVLFAQFFYAAYVKKQKDRERKGD